MLSKTQEQECDGIFGPEAIHRVLPVADSHFPGVPDVRYDHNTAQIITGKIGSIRLHMHRAFELPIKDGTAGSSDPFVRIMLWEVTPGHRRCVADVSTQIKLMTLNPVFDEFFDLDVNTSECELELTAYDWDEDGTHDFMGKVSIPLREFVDNIVQQRATTYRQNLDLARTVARTAGSKNIVGRSLGGAAVLDVNEIYGLDTAYGRVGWNVATGIKALATSVQRSSELPDLRPKLYREKLKGMGGGMDSLDGGQLVFTTTFVPAARPRTIANVPMFPRKTLEHYTPMTPASKMLFENKEFLHSAVVEDASWAKSRTLTQDVMWPKAPVVSSMETVLTMRATASHLTWRNLIEPTRPYKQPLPLGVCKNQKTGLQEMEVRAAEVRREDLDTALRLADRLWGQKENTKGSLKGRLQRAAGKALDSRAYRTRSDASKAISAGQTQFEEYKHKDAIVCFEEALRIASDGSDREMAAASHKWLGDSWRVLGEFRKARYHHKKHMELSSTTILDQSGDQGTRNEQEVRAFCRQENIQGPAASYVLKAVQQAAVWQDQGREQDNVSILQVKPQDLAAVVQVIPHLSPFPSLVFVCLSHFFPMHAARKASWNNMGVEPSNEEGPGC